MRLREFSGRQVEKVLRKLPEGYKDEFLGLVLRYIPIPALLRIPCSYSNYLKSYMPKEGDVVIDAGAHVGNCAVLFSRLVGESGKVVSLEPFEASYQRLVERKKKWKLDNVECVQLGLWDESGTLGMRVFTDTALGATMANEVDKEVAAQDLQVEVMNLDDLAEHLQLEHVELVKMDIEGAEIEAVQGAKTFMARMNPVFAIASYHIRQGQPTARALTHIFREKGFDVHTIESPHKTTCARRGLQDRSGSPLAS